VISAVKQSRARQHYTRKHSSTFAQSYLSGEKQRKIIYDPFLFDLKSKVSF
jgi:hypothetical protein